MASGNTLIEGRLAALRGKMEEQGIDYWLIPTADYHGSEYVSDFFKTREYFSGFTGSAGTLLAGREGAWLWTDGRYFIQAAVELEGTGITLMKMREEGVPNVEEFLREQLAAKGSARQAAKEDARMAGPVLAVDGRVISAEFGMQLEELTAESGATLLSDCDPAESIWKDRPAFPAGEIYRIPESLAGKSYEEKAREVLDAVAKAGADSIFLNKLDDIMWLLNIRGRDVECNPVAISCFYLSQDEAVLYVRGEAVNREIRGYLEEKGIGLEEYETVWDFPIETSGKRVLMDKRYLSYMLYRKAPEGILFAQNPTERLKAIKNPVELENMRRIYHKDNVALTKFIYWLKTNIGKLPITEVTAAEKLDGMRREIPEFLELSFPTIAGYGPNAALMHYEAAEESCATLEPRGFLLVDSGGQYFGGTTDVTRTISLGALTEEERRHYTLVAAGMIQETNARFLAGCTGRNLDILARGPLWDQGLDYKCGTGHGVGYILNVHEGPQALRWQYNPRAGEVPFEEGMDVTNEPGIYVEGSHGIRIENVMVARKGEKNEYGQFMFFETLTWVPLDREALDPRYLSPGQIRQINAYLRETYRRLSPELTPEEREWLQQETSPL